jgi:o-succinylbenzoate synthase
MQLQASYFKKVFQFNFKARTSRGPMEDKVSWFVKLWDEKNPSSFGIGECGPLPGLSLDATIDFEGMLNKVIVDINGFKNVKGPGRSNPFLIPSQLKEIVPPDFPAIRFGIETAWLDLQHGGKRMIFHNDFLSGKPIPINGLIWMGKSDEMIDQVHKKVSEGFRCIKLKIGGLDFEEECDVLREIRGHYPSSDITIRLDANGAFTADEALTKLQVLSKFEIHSIEQPIKEGQAEMRILCEKSPIPIALDEELIRHQLFESKRKLLKDLQPPFIILKPTLHGGISGCEEWIDLATSMGTGWWLTSALESNVGLNAICQYAASHLISLPQGLGTGAIYQNNIDSPLTVSDGHIFYDESKQWNVDLFGPEK